MKIVFVLLIGLLLLGPMFVNLAHAGVCEEQCCEAYGGHYTSDYCNGLTSSNQDNYQNCVSYCNSYVNSNDDYNDYGDYNDYSDYGHESCCAPAFVLGIALLGSYWISKRI